MLRFRLWLTLDSGSSQRGMTMWLEQQIMAACGHAMGAADPTMESPDPGPAFLQKQASGVFAFAPAPSHAAIF